MAEGAVSFLLGRIESFVVGEWELQESVKTDIDNLKCELDSMKAVAKVADARVDEHNDVVRLWVEQVRGLAFEIEHILDKFELHLSQCQQQNLLQSQFIGFHARRSIANPIREIKKKLKSLRQTKERYSSSFSSSQATLSSSTSSGGGGGCRRIAALYPEDVDIVGMEEHERKLISWALEQNQTNKKVMFVVGMGGSGKRALVRKVYKRVKEYFDFHAWINVSRSNETVEILRDIFNGLFHNQTTAEPTSKRSSGVSGSGSGNGSFSRLNNEVEDLVCKLRNHLQDKRYVIVLDDLWNKDVWKFIRFVLPVITSSTRIIIITRRGDIASLYGGSCIDVYNIELLRPEKAQELFYKTAFPQSSGVCPSGLVEWSWKILKICDGLPLGIIEIGRFLAKKEKAEYEWKKLHDGLESELRSDGPLSNIMTVLLLSYNDLPYHLKYCFLYLSNFPEGYTFSRRRLIRLWMAEGFLRKETGKDPEDVGEEYLKELIQRSLIQAIEWDFHERPRSFRVHNLMHKIILSKARDENFCTVYNETEGNATGEKTTRRLSIQKSGFDMSQKDFPYGLHTLFMFGTNTSPSHHSKLDNIPSINLELLKVLQLEGTRLDTFPKKISDILLLKYLCLSKTQISIIPKIVGKLRHLETLDLKQTLVRMLPKEIMELDKLRHLLVCNYNIGNTYVTFDCVEGFEFEESSKISTLINLKKLSFVKANDNHNLIRDLGGLTQLRKLGIIDLLEEDGPILCHSIQMLQNLQSLNVTSLLKEQYLHLQEINNPPRLLQRLYLKGRLKRLPAWISILHDLVRIRLKWSRLAPENNPIAILQDLPNLLELQLLEAYTGNQLEFNADKFQKLKILEFEQMEELKMVVLDIGTLPCLEKLIIKKCVHLQQVPVGIDSLSRLKELHLYDMPPNFLGSLERDTGELRDLVHHIPQIHAFHRQIDDYWVPEDLS